MRLFSILFILALATSLFSQNYNMSLLDTVEFPGQDLANIWGYTDGSGNEYALVGAANGLYVLDVTVPTSRVFIEQLTDGISSLWREVKTFGQYAYIVSEGTSGGQGGVGIADLSGLPATPLPFHKYRGDGAINNQLNRAHSLDVDEATGYLYVYGTTGLANGGAVCLDLNGDPYNPTYVGQYNTSYIHDGYANNDTLYGGHIYAGEFSIIDFTTKNTPVVVATQTTPNAFTHNTWLTDDGNYILATDEKSNAYLTMYDISNAPTIVETDRIRTTPGSGSIVHNTYVVGNHAVTSWYKDGVTITDISRPGNIIQVGRYDTYTFGSGNGFAGCWGVYPYLPSGVILASNMHQPLASGGNGGVMYILSSSFPDACFLEGTVTDQSSGAALFGVSVEIQHTDPLNSDISGTAGEYATGQPTSGTFDVLFTKSGYVSQTIQVSLTNGAVTTLDVQMQSAALPLDLISFSARPEGKWNALHWVTAQETNTLKHEIQRKTNPDEHWKTIGEVSAAGDAAGESVYVFYDKNPFPECHYRLRFLDLDGSDHYSEVQFVERPNTGFSIENIYPVPSHGELEIRILSDEIREGKMMVGNFSGQLLLEKGLELEPGENKVHLKLPDDWANGQYWFRLDGGNRVLQEMFLLEK